MIVGFSRKFAPAGPPKGADCTLLLHGDGTNGSTTFTDSSSSGLVATRTGTVSISTSQSKFGGASINFGGGYLAYAAPTGLAFGTGAFTVDFWIRFTSLTDSIIYDTRPNGGTANSFVVYILSSKFTIAAPSFNLIGTSILALNTWYHVAFTRGGGTARLFVNGSVEASSPSSDNFTLASGRPTLGAASTSLGAAPIAGFIDEFRVRKGTAEWTANFTPPTAPYV